MFWPAVIVALSAGAVIARRRRGVASPGCTVNSVGPVTPSLVALIVAGPAATPVARPVAGLMRPRGIAARPDHLAGEVLARAVGEHAGGGERCVSA